MSCTGKLAAQLTACLPAPPRTSVKLNSVCLRATNLDRSYYIEGRDALEYISIETVLTALLHHT